MRVRKDINSDCGNGDLTVSFFIYLFADFIRADGNRGVPISPYCILLS